MVGVVEGGDGAAGRWEEFGRELGGLMVRVSLGLGLGGDVWAGHCGLWYCGISQAVIRYR